MTRLTERELEAIRWRARVGLPLSHAHTLYQDVRGLLNHIDQQETT